MKWLNVNLMDSYSKACFQRWDTSGMPIVIMLNKLKLGISSLWQSLLIFLPDEFSKYRVNYYNSKGCKIDKSATISPNVRIRGYIELGAGSSIAQNCSIAGGKVGVIIGKNVMIAPNVVIVAFSHGHKNIEQPMRLQENVEKIVIIEDNVWVAANCTIGKVVRIGTGAIISANSFVLENVLFNNIVGGVPAKIIGIRSEKPKDV